MNKLVLGLVMAAAFVAGTIATAIPVYAPPPPGDGGWKDAVADLEEEIDKLKANEILGFYQKSNITLGDGGALDVKVNCDEGDAVTGGGHAAASFNSFIRVSSHQQDSSGDGWRNIWQSAGDGFGHITTVECADYAPAHVP